ncbi:hypothetical protein [Alteriqipengyuania lutimaris]|uniref:Uncharacterized protein n=1 Tax=Alteriqipengyuania lutimaris TaxID=1538146 RepID=A0A395LML7_9SPHN|nr:hypothetical protein [Alteriqipengyuania lutimaris]MBB3033316.1 hypothetical protein [Alteriqipengyuania lutimaris]RDS77647.1 hypothetical protein DL238_08560 [Alteriqipengyuania lutimaris]
MLDIVLSLLVLAALLLIGGAVILFRRGFRKQAGLMVVAALVALMNVAIWTIPDSSGTSPVDGVPGENGPAGSGDGM